MFKLYLDLDDIADELIEISSKTKCSNGEALGKLESIIDQIYDLRNFLKKELLKEES